MKVVAFRTTTKANSWRYQLESVAQNACSTSVAALFPGRSPNIHWGRAHGVQSPNLVTREAQNGNRNETNQQRNETTSKSKTRYQERAPHKEQDMLTAHHTSKPAHDLWLVVEPGCSCCLDTTTGAIRGIDMCQVLRLTDSKLSVAARRALTSASWVGGRPPTGDQLGSLRRRELASLISTSTLESTCSDAEDVLDAALLWDKVTPGVEARLAIVLWVPADFGSGALSQV
jgi:hypothetical protein